MGLKRAPFIRVRSRKQYPNPNNASQPEAERRSASAPTVAPATVGATGLVNGHSFTRTFPNMHEFNRWVSNTNAVVHSVWEEAP